AEITDGRPDALIAWRSLAGADLDPGGSVRVEAAPGGRRSFVRVWLEAPPPLAGAARDHAGSVRFEAAPGGRGTFVRFCMQYHPPGGALGTVVASLFGEEPGQDLRVGLGCSQSLLD